MNVSINHEDAFELLPWIVNGTLHGEERELVEDHVATCLVCRAELKSQRALRTMLREQPTLSLSAEEDYDRLTRRLDVSGPRSSHALLPRLLSSWFRAAGGAAVRPLRLAGAAALAVALAVGLWFGLDGRGIDDTAEYATLTEANGSAGLFVDIVFAPGLSEADMRAFLRDIEGTIVVGPSEIGRYTVRLNLRSRAADDRDALMASLQSDPRVRFAGWNFTLDRQDESP